jgi:lauroyl/myristoyl acyltransferase
MRWLRRGGRLCLFIALRGLARVAGFRRAPALAKLLGELEYRVAWRRRLRCERDMALALGRSAGDPWVAAQLRRAHHANAQTTLEILALLDRRQDEGLLASRLALEGLESLQATRAEGRGAILLGTHAGNGILLVVQLAAAGWPVSVVYRQARMAPAGFFARGLARYGIEGILANDGLRAYQQMVTAVKQGRLVFVTIDQGVKRPQEGIGVRFLGKDMAVAAGPALLARHTRATVLPILATGYDGAWRFRIEPPLPPACGPLATDVERLAHASERQALRHPELWSWHHRRWHKYPLARATMPAWEKDDRPCSTSTHRP